MSETKTVTTGGTNLATLLLVLFIGLKLTGFITWSWWWVLSPAWLPLAVVLVIFIGVFLVNFIIEATREIKRWKRARARRKAHEKAREAEVKAVDAAMAAERKLRSGEVK